MFFRKIIRMHQPTVLKRKPIIIVRKGVTPEGNPFKQAVTESGENYITNGKPSGFSISKGVSFVSGPNMKIKEAPKKKRGTHLTLKNIVNDLFSIIIKDDRLIYSGIFFILLSFFFYFMDISS